MYYAKAKEGSWMPATCNDMGKFHMPGEIRIAPRDMQLDLSRSLHPLFEVLEQRNILLVTPLPRYITGSCCDDKRPQKK
jgi:hypothetical protein